MTAELRGREAALLSLAVLGAAFGLDGLLLSTVGTTALVPSVASGPVTWAVAGAGGILAVSAAIALGPRLLPAAREVVPRLYPFASALWNAAIVVALLISAVSVYSGFFELFTGAHDSGNFDQLANQGTLSILLDAATALLWLVTLYAVLLIHRFVSIGRFLDSRPGRVDAYGQVVEPADPPAPPRPGWTEPPPAGVTARRTLVILSVLFALPVSAGIQVLESGVAPSSPLQWLVGLLFLPALVLPVALGIVAVDRGVRDLEHRYAAVSSTPPPGAFGLANPSRS